jgi:hypothetical protein
MKTIGIQSVLVLTLALAQSMGVQVAEGVQIEGIVVDNSLNSPISAASISVAGFKVSSGVDGRFLLKSVPPGKYQLIASKSGYVSPHAAFHGSENAGLLITIQPNQPVQQLMLRLVRTGAVSGRIYDAEGKGLAQRVVIPYRATYDYDGTVTLKRVLTDGLSPPRETSGISLLTRAFPEPFALPVVYRARGVALSQTNDLGDFRIVNLEPGRYAFYIVPMTNNPPDPMFYPGVVDRTRADIVDVQSGQQTNLRSITLASTKEATLYARTLDLTGQRGSSTYVQVRRLESPETLLQANIGSSMQTVPCGENARACTKVGPLAAGSYEVEAVISVPGGSFIAATRARIEMTSDDAVVELPVSRGAILTGKVVARQTDGSVVPVPGLRINLRSPETLPNVAFPITSNSTGEFRLNSIPHGVYRVTEVEGVPPHLCLREVLQDERNMTRSELAVVGSEVSLTVNLASSEVSMDGAVTDVGGQPIHGAIVALIPDDRARGDLYRSATTDQNGIFELSCIEAGPYRLLAWRELEGKAYRNLEFISSHGEAGQPISVGPSGRYTAETMRLP